jgi:hypothetical protein
MGMKGSGFAPRLPKCHSLFIFFASFQHVNRGPPISLRNLCEGPGVTFPARKVTTRLIDGEIVFGAGEVNRGDQPEESIFCLFEGGFAGERLISSNLYKTVALWISLFN